MTPLPDDAVVLLALIIVLSGFVPAYIIQTSIAELAKRLDRIEHHLGISEGVKEKEPQP